MQSQMYEDMEDITWNSSISSLFDPSLTQLTISPDSNSFMFAIEIFSVNLNNATQRTFHVSMHEQYISNGEFKTGKSSVQLVACTAKHFSTNKEMEQSFQSLPTYRWLCPPLGYRFGIHGKYTSKRVSHQQIDIRKCNNTLDPTRPYASNSTIADLQAQLGQFSITFFYKNPLVNPGEKQYLSYYLEDRNFITFTRQLGTYSNAYLQDFQVSTDVSLLPFSQNLIVEGAIIPDLFQNAAFSVSEGRATMRPSI